QNRLQPAGVWKQPQNDKSSAAPDRQLCRLQRSPLNLVDSFLLAIIHLPLQQSSCDPGCASVGSRVAATVNNLCNLLRLYFGFSRKPLSLSSQILLKKSCKQTEHNHDYCDNCCPNRLLPQKAWLSLSSCSNESILKGLN